MLKVGKEGAQETMEEEAIEEMQEEEEKDMRKEIAIDRIKTVAQDNGGTKIKTMATAVDTIESLNP